MRPRLSLYISEDMMTFRKLVLAEHNKDRTEDKAGASEDKIRRLQVGAGQDWD